MASYNRPVDVIFGSSLSGYGPQIGVAVYAADTLAAGAHRGTVLVALRRFFIYESGTQPGTYYTTIPFDTEWSGYIVWDVLGHSGYGAEESFFPQPSTLVATGLDVPMLTGPVSNADARSSGGKMLRFLVNRFLNRVTETASQQVIYADDGTTAIATASISDTGTQIIKGSAT